MLQLCRLCSGDKSSPCRAVSTLGSSIRDCMIPLDFRRRRLVGILYNLFEGVTSMPELPDLFRASNLSKQVRFSVIECFSELSFCALANSRSFVGLFVGLSE